MTPPKPRRGFAALDPEQLREMARKGGQAAWDKGTAHRWTVEEAKQAGRKGGWISRARSKALAEGNQT